MKKKLFIRVIALVLLLAMLAGCGGKTDTPAPTEAVTTPTAVTVVPTEASTEPAEATAQPTGETTEPTGITVAPTEETAKPTAATKAPAEETAKPTVTTKAPTKETAKPTETTKAKPTIVTIKPTVKSTAATKAPTKETVKPTAATKAPTQPAVTEAPTIAGSAYVRAVAEVKKVGAVTMDVTQKTTTHVGAESFALTVNEILSYGQLNTDSPIVQLEEKFPDTTVVENYTEYYAQGTVYMELAAAGFRGKLTQGDAEKRYVPVGMLDAAQYKEVTAKTEGDTTLICFADPVAGEDWVMPEGAKLVTAAGSAKLDKAGKLTQMQYTVTYSQGTVETTVETEAKLRESAQSVTLPAQKDTFTELSYVDALRVLSYAQARYPNLSSVVASYTESVLTMKDGQLASGDNSVNTYNLKLSKADGDLKYRINGDLASSNTGTKDVQITYKDGKRTNQYGTTRDISEAQAREEFCKYLYPGIVEPEYWKDVTLTELNGVDYLEFTYTQQWDEEMHKSACSLTNCTQECDVKESTGYAALDLRTGLLTAAGYRNEWKHQKYTGTATTFTQRDMKIEAPAAGAYKAVSGNDPTEEEPAKEATPLLYRVTGLDNQEIWLFGTIHIGDERTAYLPQEVYDALQASDALALEFDDKQFQRQLSYDSALRERLQKAYYYTDTKTKDHLDEDVYELALKYIKASGNYNMNVTGMKVALWENTISNFYLQLGHQYVAEKGVEERLTELAETYRKQILEVESGIQQVEMLTGWSDDLQDLLLTNTLQTDLEAYSQSNAELYELWCAGDEAALRERINQENTLPMLPQSIRDHYNAMLEEYDKGMNEDRNKLMLQKALDCLRYRQKVFFAVGIAHLLDDTSGLVDGLRQAGYTVELVKYS